MKKYNCDFNFKTKMYDIDKLKEVMPYKDIGYLNLSNNSLLELPKEIANLINLKSLNLARNKLVALPRSMKSLHYLIDLNLSNNEFSNVPEVLFFGLRNLRVLDFSFNKIIEFNDIPHCISNILEFKISNNLLTEIPNWIFNSLCKLKIIELNNNAISTNIKLNDNYFKSGIYESLNVLKMENCHLVSESIEFLNKMYMLEILHLGNSKNCTKNRNYFENKDNEFFQICHKHLKYLSLQNANISFLPLDFGNCFQNIVYLDLSENKLSWLPETMCNLIFLQSVNLNCNQILFLPYCIGNLLNLEKIHLCNNKLSSLPKSFTHLKNLKFIDLYNNQLEIFECSIFKNKELRGIDLELNYLPKRLINNIGNNEAQYKYTHLKSCFRKLFDVENSRYDGQKKKTECAENFFILSEIENGLKESSEIEDDEVLDVHIESVGVGNNLNNLNEENWDLDVLSLEEDDFFDPNATQQNFKNSPFYLNHIKLNNNYCPGKSHISSLFICNKNNEDIDIFNIEEGQFDSD